MIKTALYLIITALAFMVVILLAPGVPWWLAAAPALFAVLLLIAARLRGNR